MVGHHILQSELGKISFKSEVVVMLHLVDEDRGDLVTLVRSNIHDKILATGHHIVDRTRYRARGSAMNRDLMHIGSVFHLHQHILCHVEGIDFLTAHKIPVHPDRIHMLAGGRHQFHHSISTIRQCHIFRNRAPLPFSDTASQMIGVILNLNCQGMVGMDILELIMVIGRIGFSINNDFVHKISLVRSDGKVDILTTFKIIYSSARTNNTMVNILHINMIYISLNLYL